MKLGSRDFVILLIRFPLLDTDVAPGQSSKIWEYQGSLLPLVSNVSSTIGSLFPVVGLSSDKEPVTPANPVSRPYAFILLFMLIHPLLTDKDKSPPCYDVTV